MKRSAGFTLIELCLVTAMISILAVIAIPKFSQVVAKSQQAATKGNFGALRSALAIYYAEMEGQYPRDDLSVLTIRSRYISAIPPVMIPKISGLNPGHAKSQAVCSQSVSCVADAGGWGYENLPPDYVDPFYGTITWGTLMVNCTHAEMNGQIWALE